VITRPPRASVDRPFFDVAAAEQVLMNGASLSPVEDALSFGVVPQQIAFVVGQIIHSAYLQCVIRLSRYDRRTASMLRPRTLD
jgi:hypothetical protein